MSNYTSSAKAFQLFLLSLASALGVACGSSSKGGTAVGAGGTEISAGGSSSGSGGEGTGLSQGGGEPNLVEPGTGGGNANNCVPTTCEALGKDCGPVADGCGDVLECGSCGDNAYCGIVTSNVCTSFAELCTPATRDEVCAGKECGVTGDGCGQVIDCGSCGNGEGCGVVVSFQCDPVITGNVDECPAEITDCAAVSAECGLIGNGCGGTLDCGPCGGGEVCGLNTPQVCGAVPVCQPLDPAVACQGKCGLVSNGCGSDVAGGVIDCQALFPCPGGQTCGGGGVANQCGSSATVSCQLTPQATACAGRECGAVSNGCDGSYSCGTCGGGSSCSAGQCTAAPVCNPTPIGTACNGKACGQAGNGCGGTHVCGTCSGGQSCGAQVAFQCSTPPPPVCVPLSQGQACAGKECGTAFDGCGTAPANTFTCGTCVQGEFCGLETAFQCDAPEVPPCVPNGNSCASLGWACGLAINNCGDVFDCETENRTCSAFQACTGGIDSPTSCTGAPGDCDLCDNVPPCAQNSPTRLTGRVITPGRTDGNTGNQVGVPNAFVYILRNNDVGDLPTISTGIPTGGTSCDRCSDQDLGPVLASAVTDSDGNYTLSGNIPTGTDFLLVTKVGKFRRAVVHQVAPAAACTTTALATTLPNNPTRLPRSSSDGSGVNLPAVAISTGQIDAMECVFEKMGIAQTEFGNFGSAARIHLYRGGTAAGSASGASIDGSTPFDADLYGSLTRMQSYDMVVADCEGQAWDGTAFNQRIANGANVRQFVNRGGRMFASHLSFSWLHQNSTQAYAAGTFATTGLGQVATWDTDILANLDNSGTGQVSLLRPAASPRIQNFSDWMSNEGVTNASNQFAITDPRSMALTLGPTSEEFVFRSGGNGRVQQFSFNTPYGAPVADSCGRVAYSGFHVAATGGGSTPFATSVFPAHCTGNLTSQEKVLLYMLFDLGACVGDEPEPPACVPEACPTDGSCGVIGNGCGGQQDCGCPQGDACIAGQCETPGCVPTTCEAEGVLCSSISDGCGQVLNCACPVCTPVSQQTACTGVTCGTASDGCSGVYTCSTCPSSCNPITNCPAQFDCGVVSDGCDGSVDCGDCEPGEVCGAGGPNVCAVPECQPLSCEDLDATCGMIGDGCGGSEDCGPCQPGQTCTTVGGIPNQCDGCQPRSCEDAGAQCGLIGDGCGDTVECGPCPSGQICGAQSPNQCGNGPSCPPQTCEVAGADCGIIGDGCGGQVDCGPCPGGQLCGIDTPFQCGDPPVCNAATCASLGAQCGAIGDGCGALLDCGDCAPGATCGLGEANKCRMIR